MGIHWTTVKDAEIRYIVGLLRKRDLDGITDLGIDEVSEKKGHRYLTLVTDTIKRRVIWVGRGSLAQGHAAIQKNQSEFLFMMGCGSVRPKRSDHRL